MHAEPEDDLAELARGTQVGRYVVLSKLGQGAMGFVYRAYDPELDRAIALKIVRGPQNARTAREGKALARLAHPNVVTVHDVGVHENHSFVAMELVEGETLQHWLGGKRTQAEIVAMFVAAGRGLAAAHEANVVHRDFKPGNVIVGRDGRARVVDFGLAVAGGGTSSTAVASARVVAAVGTGSWAGGGSLVGTPRYVAPEQALGEETGPAADQFSFCASLWEALSGDAPFEGQNLLEILGEVHEGRLRETGSRIPDRIRRILQRGLLADPPSRYPSMSALLDDLVRDPTASRRRAATIGAAAVVLVGAGWLFAHRGAAPHDPCDQAAQDLAGAWDADVRSRVAASFAATGRPYADDTTARVGKLLDAYAGEYRTMRRQVCEASGGRPSSRELLALRDACLDRRQGRLRALTAVFADKAGAEVLDRAVSASASLPPVSDCADTEALLARVRPPDDPAVKAQVATLQPRVDRLGAMYDSGQWQAALAESEDVVAAAMAVPYPPLGAQAKYWRGALLERTGDYERAKRELREAAPLAAQGHDDVLASLAWTRILYIVGERQWKLEEAAAVRTFGETLLARAHDDFASLMWLQTEGVVECRAGHFANALALEQRALALAVPLLGEDHPQVATVLNNVGMVQSGMGDPKGAIATHERALHLRERVLGPDHPNVAQSLNNLGVAFQYTGEPARARDAYARAAAIWEKDLGPEHPDVGTAISNGSEALFAMGDVAGAITMGRRALQIREKALGPDHPQMVETLDDLGTYLRASGELDEASGTLERALAIRERALGPEANDVGLSLGELARVRVAQKRLDDADRLLARARVCVRASPADDKARLGIELATAELLAARGRRAEAAALIQRELPHTVPELRPQFEQALVSLEASPPR